MSKLGQKYNKLTRLWLRQKRDTKTWYMANFFHILFSLAWWYQ